MGSGRSLLLELSGKVGRKCLLYEYENRIFRILIQIIPLLSKMYPSLIRRYIESFVQYNRILVYKKLELSDLFFKTSAFILSAEKQASV